MDPFALAYGFMILGVVLALSELFIPTGGINAILGGVSALVGCGIIFAYGSLQDGMLALMAVCIGGPLLAAGFMKVWPYTPMGSRRLLKSLEEDVTVAEMSGNAALDNLKGKIGKAVSSLRPSGVAEFDGRRIDCYTEGMMVDPGQWVRCIEARAGRIVVRPCEPPKVSDFERAEFS
jgi:membrane-bound ClpP family serine protease